MTAGLVKPTARTLILLALLAVPGAAAAEPMGTVTWAGRVTLPFRWLDTLKENP